MVNIAFADKFSVVCANGCQRAVFVLAVYARDFVCVHPTVPLKHAFFLAFFEIYRVWHKVPRSVDASIIVFCSVKVNKDGIGQNPNFIVRNDENRTKINAFFKMRIDEHIEMADN